MTTIAQPARIHSQRLTNLQKANRVRSRRARLKADIFNGTASVADVLLSLPKWAESMSVYDLLIAQRQWGCKKALRVLRGVPISAPRQLGRLTVRERRELASVVTRARPRGDSLASRDKRQ